MQFQNAINSAANCVLHTTLHKNVFILSFTTKDPLGNAKRLGRMGNCAGKDSFNDDDASHVRVRNGDDRGLIKWRPHSAFKKWTNSLTNLETHKTKAVSG